MENLINLSNKEIQLMTEETLHQNFLKIRSEINRLQKNKERSIDLEIIYCYFVKEIEERN